MLVSPSAMRVMDGKPFDIDQSWFAKPRQHSGQPKGALWVVVLGTQNQIPHAFILGKAARRPMVLQTS